MITQKLSRRGTVLGAFALATQAAAGTGSVWRAPVPAGPRVPLRLPTGVAIGLDSWDDLDAWSIPVYAARAADKLRPLLYNARAWEAVAAGEWRRSGNIAAVERDILASAQPEFPYQGNVFSTIDAAVWVLPADYNRTVNPKRGPAQFHIPGEARPAGGTDGHLVVFQPDGRALELYAAIVMEAGPVIALSYALTDPASAGDGWQNGQTASMLPAYAGLIEDSAVRGGNIGHALALTLPPALLRPAFTAPAFAFDRDALTGDHPYRGDVPMGARLALPLGVETQTPQGRAIAEALRTYGGFVVDRGGEGISLRVLRNDPHPDRFLHHWDWGLQSDLDRISLRLERVG